MVSTSLFWRSYIMSEALKSNTLNAVRTVRLPEKQFTAEHTFRTEEGSTITRILAAAADSAVTSVETLKDEARHGGKTEFTLIYADEEGKVCRLTAAADFSDKFESPLIRAGAPVHIDAEVQDVTASDQSGQSVTLTAVVGVWALVSAETETAVLRPAEDLIVKNAAANVCTVSARLSRTITVEDEFEIKGQATEVHYAGARAEIHSRISGSGAVTLDGNLHVTFTYTDTEKGGTQSVLQSLPFSYEFDAAGCNFADSVFASVKVAQTRALVAVDEERDESTVSIAADICVFIECYRCEEAQLPVDAFSPTHKLRTESAAQPVTRYAGCVRTVEKIEGNLRLDDDMAEVYRILAVCRSGSIVTGVSKSDGRYFAEGIITGNVLYEDTEGQKYAVSAEVPFSVPVETNVEDALIIACSTVTEIYARCRNGRDIDIFATVVIQADIFENDTISCLTQAEVTEPRSEEYPLSIYFAQRGESRFEACKHLCCTEAELARQNDSAPDVFEKEERLVLYRSALTEK